MLTRKAVVIVCLLVFVGCGDDEAGNGKCPDSIASNSAEWSATDTQAQCVDLAAALNASGANVTGGDDSGTGECTGRMSQTESGGMCRATIASQCEGGLSFELDCVVKPNRTDCAVTIEAPELDRPCRLEVLLR